MISFSNLILGWTSNLQSKILQGDYGFAVDKNGEKSSNFLETSPVIFHLFRVGASQFHAEYRRRVRLLTRRLHRKPHRSKTYHVNDLRAVHYRLDFADCSNKCGHADRWSCIYWSCLRRHLCRGAGEKRKV
jgi:hypothetical protein